MQLPAIWGQILKNLRPRHYLPRWRGDVSNPSPAFIQRIAAAAGSLGRLRQRVDLDSDLPKE
jgi:hypothetical protein